MPKYKKGETGNPNGRPKGSENKERKQLREFLGYVIDNNRDKFEAELMKLKGMPFLMIWKDLLEYCTPKLQRTELKSDNESIKKIEVEIFKSNESKGDTTI